MPHDTHTRASRSCLCSASNTRRISQCVQEPHLQINFNSLGSAVALARFAFAIVGSSPIILLYCSEAIEVTLHFSNEFYHVWLHHGLVTHLRPAQPALDQVISPDDTRAGNTFQSLDVRQVYAPLRFPVVHELTPQRPDVIRD